MKRKVQAGIGLFLAFVMLLGVFPATALAADGEAVLTSVQHSSAVSSALVSETKTVTLTVAYNYPYGTVDLSDGLDIAYDGAVYASASAGFPSGSVAQVGGGSVSMTVTYLKKDDPTPYISQYNVYVIRTPGVTPSFTGTISKTITTGSYTFTAADFTEKYTQNSGGSLGAVSITGSNPSFGSLKLGGQGYVLGEMISVSDLESGKLVFEAAGQGTVSYIVKAYASDAPQTAIGSVTLNITSQPVTSAGTVAYQTAKNTPAVLKGDDFAEAFSDSAGGELSYVKFTLPTSSQGRLYYNYRAADDYDSLVLADTAYYNGTTPSLSGIAFVPAADYAGTVTIAYKAYGTDGRAFDGSLTVTVGGSDTGTSPKAKEIHLKTYKGAPVSFDASDFNAACRRATGKDLSHVTFSLPLSSGGLYYDYSAQNNSGSPVTSDTEYYRTQAPSLSQVSFVPATGYTGSVIVSYTGYDTAGASFTGKVKITVKGSGGWDNGYGAGYFHDVGGNFNWASGAIIFLYNRSIVDGCSPGYYLPGNHISRGDFILMLTRAFDLDSSFDSNFSDVRKGSYYYNAIGTAKKLGIGRGSNGSFNPDAPLTREDAMVLLMRALEASDRSLSASGGADLSEFSDGESVSDYAVEACSALVEANIIQGNDRKLNPKGNMSRAEMAVLLYRILML